MRLQVLRNLRQNFSNQYGAIPAIFLVAIVGLLLFLVVSATFSFRNQVFQGAFPKPESQAADGVKLGFNPSNVTADVNQTFNLDVTIDTTAPYSVSAAEIHVSFDPTKFEVSSISAGDFLPSVLQAGAVSNGDASITVGSGTSAKKGTGVVAKLTVKALQSSATPLQISINTATTQVAAIESNNNVLGDVTSASILVSGGSASGAAFKLQNMASGAITPNTQFNVQLSARSDQDAANLFAAKMTFPTDKLEVVSIAALDTNTWVDIERFHNNTTGEISVVAGKGNPGLKTTGSDVVVTTITFKAKATGAAAIAFADTSVIFRNSDNADILSSKAPLNVTIAAAASATPTPTVAATPTPTPTSVATPTASPTANPSASPAGTKGDGNNDGKLDLIDLSIMLSNYNKTSGVLAKVDMNDDGVVNAFDLTQILAILRQNGVLRTVSI